MRIFITALILLFGIVFSKGQSVHSTFQGEIVGISPFFLHLEGESSSVRGFFKLSSDSVVVPITGTLDKEGNLRLSATKKPFPIFSGKLHNRIMKGQFAQSRKKAPQTFYAINPKGEYSDNGHNYISLSLSDKGYTFESMKYRTEEPLTTHIDDQNQISLHCDSLNVKLLFRGDTLILDTLDTFRPFVLKRFGSILTLSNSFYSSTSFSEYPEMSDYYTPEGILMKLNDSCTVRVRHIPKSEYFIRKWESAHLQNKPYKAIKDIPQARKALSKYVKEISEQDAEGYISTSLEIKFKDGTKQIREGYNWEYSFVAYYPEIQILVLNNEADGYEPIDMNDSTNKERVGNPYYYSESPDRQLRIAGYYPGGAADGMYYFIERWNKSKKKYELIADLDFTNKNGTFYFTYTTGWLWSVTGKALFKIHLGHDHNYYEMEVIAK